MTTLHGKASAGVSVKLCLGIIWLGRPAPTAQACPPFRSCLSSMSLELRLDFPGTQNQVASTSADQEHLSNDVGFMYDLGYGRVVMSM